MDKEIIYQKLRNGEEVKCDECKDGIMKAYGDPKVTPCFQCDKCGNRYWFDTRQIK